MALPDCRVNEIFVYTDLKRQFNENFFDGINKYSTPCTMNLHCMLRYRFGMKIYFFNNNAFGVQVNDKALNLH